MADDGLFLALGHEALRISSTRGDSWSKPPEGDPKEKDRMIFRTAAYGNGVYVAAGKGSGGIFCPSRDGSNWDEVVTKKGIDCHNVCFGAGRFLAVGSDVNYNGTVFSYSEDGQSWSEPKEQKGKALLRIVYGDGKFVGVGASGRRATSTDGVKWIDAEDNKIENTLIDVCYGNGLFVGVGLHGLSMVSEDGIKWRDKQHTGREGEHYNSVMWTGDRFVAVGLLTTMESPDGVNWTRHESVNAPQYAAYGNGVFIGARWKGVLLRSKDAIEWEEIMDREAHVDAVVFCGSDG